MAKVHISKLPCLVSAMGSKPSYDAENLAQFSGNDAALLRAYARNFLRYFIHGSPLFSGPMWKRANLRFAWFCFKTVAFKKDLNLLKAMREEMKNVFEQAWSVCNELDIEAQNRLEAFINTFVSNFPFVDPEENEEIFLPQRINGEWYKVPYKFVKLDISPQRGWLSWLVDGSDKIYAYGLEPINIFLNARPYLLLMGTTYATGQGYYLSLLGNLTPGMSIGENHDLTKVRKWMSDYPDAKISGHSQGGSMAMLVAAQYPESTSYSLNPAMLHKSFLKKFPKFYGDNMNIYIQEKDPVYIFGDVVPNDAHVFLLSQPNGAKASLLKAHACHYLGFPKASVKHVNHPKIDSNTRYFFNDLKYLADLIVNPLLNVSLIYIGLKRKLLNFCNKHADVLRVPLFASLLILCIIFMATGILAPSGMALTAPILYAYGSTAAYAILGVFAFLGSAVAAFILPKLISFVEMITVAAITIAAWTIVAGEILLASLFSGLKALYRAAIHSVLPESNNLSWQGSTNVFFDALGKPSEPTAEFSVDLDQSGSGQRPEGMLPSQTVSEEQEAHKPNSSSLNI